MRMLIVLVALEAGFLALGPVAAWLGIVSPMAGVATFTLGGLLGLVAVVAALIVAALGRRRGISARTPLLVAAAGIVGFLFVFIPAWSARDLPRINDITTRPSDPPAFVAIAALPANQGQDMSYPASFAEQQSEAYSLAPIQLSKPPAQALEQVRHAAERLEWNLVAVDPQSGRLEATDRSNVFRFVDDIVVRVRPSESGSVIDVRSKSRVGRGDLGANAERIEQFQRILM